MFQVDPRLCAQSRAESHLEPGDDGVGVAAEVGELVVEGFGVGAGGVGPAEADDDVGDALVLQAAHAVEGVGARSPGLAAELR